jgi:6-phosphogluconate dehydrogenase
MRFGIVGLGRMGASIAEHALELGHDVVGHDIAGPRAAEGLTQHGMVAAGSLDELVAELEPPRVVIVWVPHGDPTEQVLHALAQRLEPGDVVCDGGNSHWADSTRRHRELAQGGIRFLDVGTSGGIEGARHGACFMAGGAPDAWTEVEPLYRDLAVDPEGAKLVGGPGAGHFVKLIHNGIEFGMVQAIAEGFELLERSDHELDLPGLFELWQHGSVIRSWLVGLMAQALRAEPDLEQLSTYVEDTEEVKWVLSYALERDVPTPVISESQQALMAYRDDDWPAAKAVALLRHAYGGHPVHRAGEDPPGRRR